MKSHPNRCKAYGSHHLDTKDIARTLLFDDQDAYCRVTKHPIWEIALGNKYLKDNEAYTRVTRETPPLERIPTFESYALLVPSSECPRFHSDYTYQRLPPVQYLVDPVRADLRHRSGRSKLDFGTYEYNSWTPQEATGADIPPRNPFASHAFPV